MRIARLGMVVAGLMVLYGLMAPPALAEENKAPEPGTSLGGMRPQCP